MYYLQAWLHNFASDSNKVTSDELLLKSLMEITKNTSSIYNLGVLIESAIRYVQLHYSLFGKYKGQLMPRPTEAVLNTINGTFEAFLKRNNLTPLIPVFHMSQTMPGYGYLDEIGTLYGLLWNTPNVVLTTVLNLLGDNQDPDVYVLREGYENLWNSIVKKENFDIKFNTRIINIRRWKRAIKITYIENFSETREERCGFLIWTPPMPEMLKHLYKPSKGEQELFETLNHHIFV